MPLLRMRANRILSKIDSLGLRGGLFKTSDSPRSKDRAISCKPSVTILSQRNCTAVSGAGMPKNTARQKKIASESPQDSKKNRILRIFA